VKLTSSNQPPCADLNNWKARASAERSADIDAGDTSAARPGDRLWCVVSSGSIAASGAMNPGPRRTKGTEPHVLLWPHTGDRNELPSVLLPCDRLLGEQRQRVRLRQVRR
jgi:hypothetical protein